MAEFDIIDMLQRRIKLHGGVAIGVGDDCCVLQPDQDQDLLVTMDTLVEGVHFLPNTDPRAIGHKALAVSLSDIAAMGGQPRWAMVSLTMPDGDDDWALAFAEGVLHLADQHAVSLVGGDLTQGPLSITIVVHGQVCCGRALSRSGARAGDSIYVTGRLGAAAAGLRLRRGQFEVESSFADDLFRALDYPEIPVEFARQLSGLVTASIDISDGLFADLGHILVASGIGADVQLALIPYHPGIPDDLRDACVCYGGDDYELCLTVPSQAIKGLEDLAAQYGLAVTCIGTVSDQLGLRVLDDHGDEIEVIGRGWQHFAEK